MLIEASYLLKNMLLTLPDHIHYYAVITGYATGFLKIQIRKIHANFLCPPQYVPEDRK